MDENGKVESVGEADGPVHWIYRTVSDVKQGGCVVKAQVPITDRGNVFSHGTKTTDMLNMIMNQKKKIADPSKTSAW